jgi:hypothetical protein
MTRTTRPLLPSYSDWPPTPSAVISERVADLTLDLALKIDFARRQIFALLNDHNLSWIGSQTFCCHGILQEDESGWNKYADEWKNLLTAQEETDQQWGEPEEETRRRWEQVEVPNNCHNPRHYYSQVDPMDPERFPMGKKTVN